MQFEVPQFIEIEDKIFGPFTWRQFLYLGGGVGLAVVMFFTMPLIVFAIFGIPLALLAGALSFYPVNNRPFSFFLEAVFNYISAQRLYLWRQKTEIVHRNKVAEEEKPLYVSPKNTNHTEGGKHSINSLSRRLELQALQKTE